jgi:hypothetical protein
MKITNVNDYIDKIIENHPELTKEQIKYILHFGMIAFDNYLRRGYGIKLSSPKVSLWTGSQTSADPETQIKIKVKKINKKSELQYHTDKKFFDGFYYFSLSEESFQKLKPLGKKKLKFDKIQIYKSLDDCVGIGTNCYVFRFYYPTDLGFRTSLVDETIRDYEFMGKKENGKLKNYVERNKE